MKTLLALGLIECVGLIALLTSVPLRTVFGEIIVVGIVVAAILMILRMMKK